jgi:murein DD-endopeptidase MepM/ murein hydrolase activator NlpD
MRLGLSGIHRRVMARGATVLLIGGMAAGCSSDVLRFQDSILTGSSRTAPQAAPVQQAYPGDMQLDPTSTGSVARGAVRSGGILQRAGLIPRPQADVQTGAPVMASVASNPYPVSQPVYQPPVQPAYVPPATATVTSAPLSPAGGVDTTVTGSTAPAVKPVAVAAQPMPQPVVQAAQPVAAPAIVSTDTTGGWTRAGGTQVAVKQGETVYNLSRRFGVPADAILKANGLNDASALAAGQNVVIPTYVHSAKAPVSAPDANRNVADANSSTGTRYDLPGNKVPVPGEAPGERLAILPTQPKLKEQQAGAQTASADAQRNSGSPAGNSYTVVAGDTLSGISSKTGASVEALRQANGLSSGLIRIGQTLVVPAGGAAPQVQTVQAQPGNVDQTTTATTPKAAAYTPPQKAENVLQQVAVTADGQAPDATGIGKMRWPVRGRVISDFGGSSAGKKNDGIDIAVPSGTPVKAAENGVVIYAGDGLKEFGNTVLVRHEDGLVTVYGHASEIKVQRGQQVRRGEEIALAGMSGSADTPKLHFEVRKDSSPVNPVGFLE